MIKALSLHNLHVNELIAFTATNVKSLLECSKERLHYQHRLLPTLHVFVKHMFYHCKLTPSILLVALIYLERLKSKLPRKSRGEFDTPYKIFISATILASKFIEDSKSMTQSIYKFNSPVYSSRDVNNMERYFLGVINYNLYVDLIEVDHFIKEHKDSIKLELN